LVGHGCRSEPICYADVIKSRFGPTTGARKALLGGNLPNPSYARANKCRLRVRAVVAVMLGARPVYLI
jgi:hypothetical protein